MPFGYTASTTDITAGGVGSIWTVSQNVTGTIITSSSNATSATDVGLTGSSINIFRTNDTTVNGTILLNNPLSASTTDANITFGNSGTLTIVGSATNIVTGDNTSWIGWNQAIPPHVLRRMDPEERRRIEEAQRRWEQERLEREEQRRVASEKAERLLVSALSEQQRREYLEHGHFHVRSPAGRLYRITKGWSGNVKLVPHEQAERGEFIESLCIHPKMWVPNCDNMLAQKLMIEAAEDDFRRIANIADLQRYRNVG